MVFPNREARLSWSFEVPTELSPRVLFVIDIQIRYRGAFEQVYETRVGASYPRPEVHVPQPATTPLPLDRSAAT